MSTSKLSRRDDIEYFRNELAAELAAEARAIFEPQPVTAEPAATLTLHIGRHRPIPVASAEQASRIWQIYREVLNLGGSDAPNALLKSGRTTVGYVSYNGRVWKGLPTQFSATKQPVAEAAKVEGLRIGDLIPVEDMETGTMRLVEVLAVWERDGNAVSFDWKPGQRIYFHPKRMHSRFFTNLQPFNA